MKLRISRIYHQLFIIILLLRNSVSGQIDWAEDEDDPGEFLSYKKLINLSSDYSTQKKKVFCLPRKYFEYLNNFFLCVN
jgi:hypothetical protein